MLWFALSCQLSFFLENIHTGWIKRQLHICSIWRRPKVVQVCTAICRIAGSLIHICGMCHALTRVNIRHFSVGEITNFLGMTNTEPNLLSLGQALCYTLLVISQIFAKRRICVAAWSQKTGFEGTFPSISVVLLRRLFPKTIRFAHGWTHTNHINFMKIDSTLQPISCVLIQHKYNGQS